ncbi:MAG TPA: hypothetical protein VGR87_03990 [Candidatus Limnocylindria bacterium]|nr:hypothetical protein [Candidatus Limnocylindria bacterium]
MLKAPVQPLVSLNQIEAPLQLEDDATISAGDGAPDLELDAASLRWQRVSDGLPSPELNQQSALDLEQIVEGSRALKSQDMLGDLWTGFLVERLGQQQTLVADIAGAVPTDKGTVGQTSCFLARISSIAMIIASRSPCGSSVEAAAAGASK